MEFGFTTSQIINNGLTYMGAWDANTNTPTLTSGVGVSGQYYIVSISGTTNLDGVTDWKTGDWAIFEGDTNMWQKIDNHDVQAYSFIEEEGTVLPQQNTINFIGSSITASNASGKTNVTVQAYNTIQDEGTPLTQQETIDFQGGGVTASNGIGKTIVTIPAATTYGLYAQTALGTVIAATTVETSLIGTGVGTLTVPANAFSVGDSFTAKMCGPLSCANAETLHIRVKSDGIVIIDASVFTLNITTNKYFELSLDFTVTKIGVAGVAELFANGQFSYNKNANSNIDGNNFALIDNTVFDTTVTNTLSITAQWGSANALNSIQSQNFVLTKVY